ncbi:beta-xylosidase family glycoside hydrolase, partial [[Kitasatospora] papulosa]
GERGGNKPEETLSPPISLLLPGPPAADPPSPSPPPGPDTLRLGYETEDGHVEVLAELDGRYLTTEVAGGFTGRVIGMYATRGEAAFDWFELRPA